MRPVARLVAAIGLVASAGTAAHAATATPPPSVFEERATSPATGATSDPALRQRFLSEFKSAPPEKRRTVLEAWVPRLGVAGLLDALETGFPSCHDHAHELGKAAYAVTHDMPAVLQACQTRCVSGCMHGVLMEAFTERPGSLRDRIATLCDGEAFRQIHKKGDCIHGVGHGAAYVSDYDIPRALTLVRVGGRARLPVLLRVGRVHAAVHDLPAADLRPGRTSTRVTRRGGSPPPATGTRSSSCSRGPPAAGRGSRR